MTVRSANQIRPSHMPLYCSACSGQYPDRQYVDFDAECDRGYGDVLIQGRSEGESGNSGSPIQMDWLILCDQCVKEGARIIGMIDGAPLEAENAALKKRNEILEKRAEKADNYADRMEEALEELRRKPIKLDHRQKPRRTEMANG